MNGGRPTEARFWPFGHDEPFSENANINRNGEERVAKKGDIPILFGSIVALARWRCNGVVEWVRRRGGDGAEEGRENGRVGGSCGRRVRVALAERLEIGCHWLCQCFGWVDGVGHCG